MAQLERTLETRMHLELLKFAGFIDDSHLKGKILEFGAGFGTGTKALGYFGGDVEAIEQNQSAADEIVLRDILPRNRVHCGDGLAFLNERNRTYDLVAAIMLGPLGEKDISFLREFHGAANRAIKSTGRIVVTSDIGSFKTIERFAQEGMGRVYRSPGFSPAFIANYQEPAQV